MWALSGAKDGAMNESCGAVTAESHSSLDSRENGMEAKVHRGDAWPHFSVASFRDSSLSIVHVTNSFNYKSFDPLQSKVSGLHLQPDTLHGNQPSNIT